MFPLSLPSAKFPDSNFISNQDKILCDVGGTGVVVTDPIDEGIKYLHGISGDCKVDAGPRVCSRVSCSYSAAIWLCNDTKEDLWIPCSKVGDYAQDIRDKCWFNASPGAPVWLPVVRGQEFDTENWNVILGSSPDHC